MKLQLLPASFSVCRIRDLSQVDFGSPFVFLAKTDEELSLVCPAEYVPAGCISCEGGWRALRVCGTLDFALVGVLAEISGILAAASVSIFAVSTYNTDYILVKEERLDNAVTALTGAGFALDGAPA